MMLTGATLKETMKTNVFSFFDILGATDAVIAEDSLRKIKITDNHLLLKGKDKNAYQELSSYYSTLYSEKGIRSYVKKADLSGLKKLKAMMEGGLVR